MSGMSGGGRTSIQGLPAAGRIALSLIVLLTAWGCGSDSDGDAEQFVSGRQLSIVAILRGEPVPDVTVTLIDHQGIELFEFPERTNERGYIPVTLVTVPLPRSGFVVRGCSEAEDWCLYRGLHRAPKAAAGVYLTWGTTWSYDPALVPSADVKASAVAGTTTGTTPSDATLDLRTDPLPPGSEREVQTTYDPAWASDAGIGLKAATSVDTLLNIVGGPLVSMGLHFLFQDLFPEQHPVLKELYKVETLLNQLHVDLHNDFNDLMRNIKWQATKWNLDNINAGIEFIHQTSVLLKQKLHDLEGVDDQTLKAELKTWIPQYLVPMYAQYTQDLDQLLLAYDDIFDGLKRSDTWWVEDQNQRQLYAVDYSTRIWGTYVTFLNAIATAHDLENRLYIFYMTRHSEFPPPVLDVIFDRNKKVQENPVNEFFMQHYEGLRGAFLDAIQTGIPKMLVLDDHTDFRRVAVAPYITTPATLDYMRNSLSAAVEGWAAQEQAGPGPPDIEEEDTLAQPAAPGATELTLGATYDFPEAGIVTLDGVAGQFHYVKNDVDKGKLTLKDPLPSTMPTLPAGSPVTLMLVWKLHSPTQLDAAKGYSATSWTDVDQAHYSSNLAAMRMFTDWRVGQYAMDQYLLGSAADSASLSISEVLSDSGVRLGGDANLESLPVGLYAYDAPSSRPAGEVGSWAYVQKTPSDWRNWYPKNLQCSKCVDYWYYDNVSLPSDLPTADGTVCPVQDDIVNWNGDSREYDWGSVLDCNGTCGLVSCDNEGNIKCMKPDDLTEAQEFCEKGQSQYGNYDYYMVGLPLFGIAADTQFPTNIARDYNSELVPADGEGKRPDHVFVDGQYRVSDTTMATRVTPVMSCPDEFRGKPFCTVDVRKVARNDLSPEKPIAVCVYGEPDGGEDRGRCKNMDNYDYQCTYDINVGRYVLLDRARLVATAMPHPYSWIWWQRQDSSLQSSDGIGAPADLYGEWGCLADPGAAGAAEKCQFVFLDPFKYDPGPPTPTATAVPTATASHAASSTPTATGMLTLTPTVAPTPPATPTATPAARRHWDVLDE